MIKEEKLLEHRAKNRIWLHLILWFFIPLGGGLISSYKMRLMTPIYLIIAVFCFGMTTYQASPDASKNEIVRVYQHGIKCRIVVNIVGSILIIREIRRSRKELSNRNRLQELNSEMEFVQSPSSIQIQYPSFTNGGEPILLSKNLDQLPINSQLQDAQYLWKQARVFKNLASQEKIGIV
jgi:hypothetical protein